MLFLGITGGVGAGKTSILSFIENHYKSRIMLADGIAHELMEPGTECFDRIRQLFPEREVWQKDGSICRPQLARVIFQDAARREQLNAVVHPAVKQYVLDAAAQEKKEQRLDVLVLEAALLIEEHYDEICDELWYIYTSGEVRRNRLKQSRGYSDEKISRIFASQLPEEIYRSKCSIVIDNNGRPDQAYGQITEALEKKGIAPLYE